MHLEVAEFRLDRGVVSASLKPGQIKGRSVLMPDTVSYYRANLNRMKYEHPRLIDRVEHGTRVPQLSILRFGLPLD
jgi:hypothetical protein